MSATIACSWLYVPCACRPGRPPQNWTYHKTVPSYVHVTNFNLLSTRFAYCYRHNEIYQRAYPTCYRTSTAQVYHGSSGLPEHPTAQPPRGLFPPLRRPSSTILSVGGKCGVAMSSRLIRLGCSVRHAGCECVWVLVNVLRTTIVDFGVWDGLWRSLGLRCTAGVLQDLEGGSAKAGGVRYRDDRGADGRR